MTDDPVRRTTLVDQHLAEPTRVAHVEVRRISIAPSAAAGAHTHNGAVFGTIESGSVVFQIGDEPETILSAGDIFYEPAHVVISKFDATGEGVTFLGYFLLDAGEAAEIAFID